MSTPVFGKVTSIVAAIFATAAIWPAEALAQAPGTWKWQGTIYAYLPDIGGSTTFPGNGAGSSVTVDAAKILENLKFTFMGSLEGQNGRWGMYTDVVYMDVGENKSQFRDLSIGGLPLPAGATASANYDLKGWVWTLAGTWRVSPDPNSTAEVIAGVRMLDIEQTLGWEVTGNVASIPVQGRSGESKAGLTNWDAIVGLKGRVAFGEGNKWFAPWYVDVGSGDSKLTWQAMGGLGYSFQWGDIVAAWRYLDYDMKSGKKIEGLDFNGPAIAAVFRW